MALERPFFSFNGAGESALAFEVFEQRVRSYLNPCWPVALQDLLDRSWCHEHNDRLGMVDISKILRTELVRLSQGDESGLADHTRRRSPSVFGGDSHVFLQEVKDWWCSDALDRFSRSNRSQRSTNSRKRLEC
jgi:hypothetical protein